MIKNNITILYVEDEPVVQKSVTRILNKLAQNVHLASDGEEGLELFEQYQPDIVVTDINMKHMSGIHMAHEIKKINPEQHIVFATAFDDLDYLQQAIELQVDGYINKPINIDILIRKINSIIKQIATENELQEYKQNLEQKVAKQVHELKTMHSLIDDHLIYSQTNTKGVIEHVSKAFCEISGYSKEELLGKPHNIVRHPDVPQETYKEFWSTAKSGNIWEGELKNLSKTGNAYWVKAKIFPIYKDMKIVGYAGVRLDITKEKLQQQTLQEQSKLASMGEMMSMITHQWAQPLATLGIVADKMMLKKEMGVLTPADLDEGVPKIKNIINFMNTTMNNFSQFFKNSDNEVYISIEKLFSRATNIMKASFVKQDVTVKFHYTNIDKNQQIFIAQSFFDQVLLNLYKNALDIFIEKDISDGKIDVVCSKDQNNYIFEIIDNAGGIPTNILPSIFENHFSTKGAKGTGIGLYMCKDFIEEKLGGSLIATNKDKGACFTITLPIKENKK